MQYQIINQLKYALNLSLSPDPGDALEIMTNLSTRPNYIQLLTQTIADHSLTSDLHVAAVISLKNHLDKDSTQLADDDGMKILSFAMEYLRPSTLQLWRQMIRLVTSKINANSINFHTIREILLDRNLSTNQYGFYLQLVSGVIEGGIQQKNIEFSRQILDLLETLLQNSTSLQTHSYILSTFNCYPLLRVIGQAIYDWIDIYKQTLSSLCQCDHHLAPSLKKVIYQFLRNAVPILYQKNISPKIMKNCLEVMLAQISNTQHYPQQLEFINKMNIYYSHIVEVYAEALKKKLLCFMLYSQQQYELIRYSPVVYINSNNQLRHKAQNIWVNLPRIKSSKMKQSQNTKTISFIVIDLLINGSQHQQLIGLQLLMGMKSAISISNTTMIMKVCILSKLFASQPLSSMAIKALASFSCGLKVVDLLDNHLHRLKAILLSEQFTYDKYIMYTHLSSLTSNPQILEMVVLSIQDILSEYVKMMYICPTVGLISALEELLKKLISFIQEAFFNNLIALRIQQKYYDMVIKMIINVRKHHESWNTASYININHLMKKYQQNFSYNSLLQLIKIYFYDRQSLNEEDWTYFKVIVEGAMKKEVPVFPIIYIIRVFLSKKGNAWLFRGDGEYCCILFEYVMHLMKKYSGQDNEYAGSLLIPIYMIENYHQQLPNTLLQGLWSIANAGIKYLEHCQSEQLEQTCTSLVALLLWENCQLAICINKDNIHQILQQLYIFNQSKPISEKRLILGISSILLANLPRKHLQLIMNLLEVLMDIYDNALAYPKSKSIRVSKCDDLYEEANEWDDSNLSATYSQLNSDYGMIDLEGYNCFYDSRFSEFDELSYCAQCIEFARIPQIRQRGKELFEFVIEHYQSL